MRSLAVAAAITMTLSAVPAFAQAAGQTKPAAPAPPAQTRPMPAPAAPAAQAPVEPQQSLPFPEGAKMAYINIQRIASDSSEGKAATAKVKALNDKKVTELNDKQKQLQAMQQKLQQGGSVLSDQARAALEKDIEKQQVDIQRYTQDAQNEVQELQQELQLEFQRKLMPIIAAVSQERSLQMVFSQADSGLVWAHGGLDITNDVIKRFDQMTATGSAPKQ